MISLLTLLFYYVVTLGGDHLARAGTISPAAGAWTSTILTLGFGIILLVARDRSFRLWLFHRKARTEAEPSTMRARRRRWGRRISVASFPMLLDVGEPVSRAHRRAADDEVTGPARFFLPVVANGDVERHPPLPSERCASSRDLARERAAEQGLARRSAC